MSGQPMQAGSAVGAQIQPVAPAGLAVQVQPIPANGLKLRQCASTCTIDLELDTAQQARLTTLYTELKDYFAGRDGIILTTDQFAVNLSGRYVFYSGNHCDYDSLPPQMKQAMDTMIKIAEKCWGGSLSPRSYHQGAIAHSEATGGLTFTATEDTAKAKTETIDKTKVDRASVKFRAAEKIKSSLFNYIQAKITAYGTEDHGLQPGPANDQRKKQLQQRLQILAQLQQQLQGQHWDEYALMTALNALEQGKQAAEVYDEVTTKNKQKHDAAADAQNTSGLYAKAKKKLGYGVVPSFDKSYAVDVASLVVAGNPQIDRRVAYLSLYGAYQLDVRSESPMHHIMGYLDGEAWDAPAIALGGQAAPDKLKQLAENIFSAAGLDNETVNELVQGWDSVQLIADFEDLPPPPPPAPPPPPPPAPAAPAAPPAPAVAGPEETLVD